MRIILSFAYYVNRLFVFPLSFTAGAFIGSVTLGFPGATFGMLIGAAGGAVAGGVIAAVTD